MSLEIPTQNLVRFPCFNLVSCCFSDFLTLHTIVTLLIEGGAHVDTVNSAGLTSYDVASTGS